MGLWGFGKKTLNSTIGTVDFAPLDEVIYNQLYSLRSYKQPEPFKKYTLKEYNGVSDYILGTTTTIEVGNFVYDGDYDYVVAKVEFLLKASSSDHGYVKVSTMSDFSDTVSYRRTYNSLVINSFEIYFKAQKGVTYYIGVYSSDGVGYVYSCDVSLMKPFIGIEAITSEHSSKSTPTLIGSFTAPDAAYDVNISSRIMADLKSVSSSTKATLSILTSSTYSDENVVVEITNNIGVDNSSTYFQDYNWFTSLMGLEPGKTYYVFLTGSSSSYYVYCDNLWVIFEPIYSPKSQIVQIQRGLVDVPSTETMSIPLGSIKPSKCELHITAESFNSVRFNLSESGLTLYNAWAESNLIYWEVVEHV